MKTHVMALQNFENQNDIIQMGHDNFKLTNMLKLVGWFLKFHRRQVGLGECSKFVLLGVYPRLCVACSVP